MRCQFLEEFLSPPRGEIGIVAENERHEFPATLRLLELLHKLAEKAAMGFLELLGQRDVDRSAPACPSFCFR
jgi:hypothetical protein